MLAKKINQDIYENFLENVRDAENVENYIFKKKVKQITKNAKKLLDMCGKSNKNEIVDQTCVQLHSEGSVIKNLINYAITLEKSDNSEMLVDTLTHNLDISQMKLDILKNSLKN